MDPVGPGGGPPPGDPSAFHLEVRERRGTTVVRVHGDLDVATAPRLAEVLAQRSGALVVDLRDVGAMSAAGLRVLLRADTRARTTGSSFRLATADAAERLFGILQLRGHFSYAEPEGWWLG